MVALDVPATNFPRFPELAQELQLMIWRAAAAQPQLVTFQRAMREKDHKHDAIRTASYPALYDVCQLSRQALVEQGAHKITATDRFEDIDRTNRISLISGNEILSNRDINASRTSWIPPSYMLAWTLDTVYICKNLTGYLDMNSRGLMRARGGLEFLRRLEVPRIAISFDFSTSFQIMFPPAFNFASDELQDADLTTLIYSGMFQEIILVHSRKGLSVAQQTVQAKQELEMLEKYLDRATQSHERYLRQESREFLRDYFHHSNERMTVGGYGEHRARARTWKAPRVVLMSEAELLARF